MSMRDQVAVPVGTEDGTPFTSPGEAWLWAVKGMQSRLDGANVKGGMADITRSCDATDVLLCAQSLCRAGKITGDELRVMLLYGSFSIAPSKLGKNHAAAIPYWQRGLEALALVLEQKGIIISQPSRARHA